MDTSKTKGTQGKKPTKADSNKEDTPIRAMILHILKVYPVISPTMLQNALGPMTKAAKWRPILDELIEEELVTLSSETIMTPHGRYNSYRKLSLTDRGLKERVIVN